MHTDRFELYVKCSLHDVQALRRKNKPEEALFFIHPFMVQEGYLNNIPEVAAMLGQPTSLLWYPQAILK